MQHIRMYNPALITQRNKLNFSTITSRINASQRRRTLPLSESRGKDRRRIRKFSGGHHRTAAVVTTAGLLLLSRQSCRYCIWNGDDKLADHRSSHRLRVTTHRSKNNGTPFHTNRQCNSFTNEYLRHLDTSFTWEEDVCSHRQLRLDWFNFRQRPPCLQCVSKKHPRCF